MKCLDKALRAYSWFSLIAFLKAIESSRMGWWVGEVWPVSSSSSRLRTWLVGVGQIVHPDNLQGKFRVHLWTSWWEVSGGRLMRVSSWRGVVGFISRLSCVSARNSKSKCWQITTTHQTNLNKRPVEILVGDIYFPQTLISQSAVAIQTTELSPSQENR